jgi:purine catabolism regulator
MAITVGELLKLPQLQMRLVAGEDGLDREISWVHTSDLPEPWAWLGSGELLLTNGTGLSPDPAAQARFVERLAGAGASGLGIGLGMSGPPLSPALFQRASELLLPVVTVPYTMPFTAVVRAVADANAREESRKELLRQLLDRQIEPAAVAAELAGTGLDLTVSVFAVARDGAAGAGQRLHRALARAKVPHLLLCRDGLVQVVLPEAAVAAGPFPGLPDGVAAVGTSSRIGAAARLPEAAAEARWALGAAEAEQRSLARYGDETSLLLPRSAAEAQALVSRILGPIIGHDAGHGTDYLNTLRTVLDHDRSWQQAAAALHVHKQTLGYRIRKIEQLTGRGITRTEDLAEWWFALRAYDLLSSRHPVLTRAARPVGRLPANPAGPRTDNSGPV